jgi:hypothetical protein
MAPLLALEVQCFIIFQRARFATDILLDPYGHGWYDRGDRCAQTSNRFVSFITVGRRTCDEFENCSHD